MENLLLCDMTLKTLGIGIWGTGVIAEFHAQALSQIPNVKLVAAYNRTPEKGRDFSKKYKISFATTPEDSIELKDLAKVDLRKNLEAFKLSQVAASQAP